MNIKFFYILGTTNVLIKKLFIPIREIVSYTCKLAIIDTELIQGNILCVQLAFNFDKEVVI